LLSADALPPLLGFLDFFAASAQHHAISTAAALCSHASPSLFQQYIVPSLTTLRNLLSHHDSFVGKQKLHNIFHPNFSPFFFCVASKALQCFASLVEQHAHSPERRKSLLGEEFELPDSLANRLAQVQKTFTTVACFFLLIIVVFV
jgi:hypothetical protein